MLNYSSIKSILSEQGLTFEVAKLLLRADFDKGELFWKPRDGDLFKSVRESKRWNSRYSNKTALNSIGGSGYRQGRIFGMPFLAHRVMVLLDCGCMPTQEIDHIDHNITNNRISNLRCSSHLQNGRNQPRKTNNVSGYNGVYFEDFTKKWRAVIYILGKKICLGRFERKDLAVAARKAANVRFGFHENHGKIFDTAR